MAATDKIEVRLKPVVASRVRKEARRSSLSINAWLTAVIEQALAAEKP
jgi:predicted HicB family RNase H-like nuclease